MELKDFIKTAIVDIVNGVTEAQEEIKDKGACINPLSNNKVTGVSMIWSEDAHKGVKILDVNFKLMIEEGKESSGGVKGGIKVSGIVNFGGQKSSKGTEQNTSSIEFSIPVSLPINSVDKEYYKSNEFGDFGFF